MPTATEPAAPKAAAAKPKPKPATKKPAEGAAEKQPQAKKPAADAKKPAADAKKPAADAKKPAAAPAADKKPTAGGDKKPASADKKPAAGDKKPAPAAGAKAADAKAADAKKPAAAPKKVEEADEPAPVPVYVPKLPVTLAVLNTLEWHSCAKVLEDLLNFTPSLGAALATLRPFKSAQHLVDQLNLALEALPLSYIEAFLKRFSELPLIPKAKLTKEHKCCVGLDKLTDEQKAELTPLYAQYREKFGFPFVVCAREAKAAELAVMIRSHLLNDKDQELQSGRKEVKKIARLRLLEVVVA